MGNDGSPVLGIPQWGGGGGLSIHAGNVKMHAVLGERKLTTFWSSPPVQRYSSLGATATCPFCKLVSFFFLNRKKKAKKPELSQNRWMGIVQC